MDTDAQEATEETIFTGDDLMTGPPAPLVPPELAPQILDGVELCSSHLRKLFECLHKNDIEPFCQDEIVIYHRCSQNRDATVRRKMYKAEETLGRVLPDDLLQERLAKLKADMTLLERRFLLASGLEGVEGFRQRWTLNGQFQDTKNRMESLEKGVASKQQQETEAAPSQKAWWHVW
ncbi:unnamed protein product [Calypogeia fissa]